MEVAGKTWENPLQVEVDSWEDIAHVHYRWPLMAGKMKNHHGWLPRLR